jgi:hypothetical protein
MMNVVSVLVENLCLYAGVMIDSDRIDGYIIERFTHPSGSRMPWFQITVDDVSHSARVFENGGCELGDLATVLSDLVASSIRIRMYVKAVRLDGVNVEEDRVIERHEKSAPWPPTFYFGSDFRGSRCCCVQCQEAKRKRNAEWAEDT